MPRVRDSVSYSSDCVRPRATFTTLSRQRTLRRCGLSSASDYWTLFSFCAPLSDRWRSQSSSRTIPWTLFTVVLPQPDIASPRYYVLHPMWDVELWHIFCSSYAYSGTFSDAALIAALPYSHGDFWSCFTFAKYCTDDFVGFSFSLTTVSRIPWIHLTYFVIDFFGSDVKCHCSYRIILLAYIDPLLLLLVVVVLLLFFSLFFYYHHYYHHCAYY